jgi:hypothetical protein
MSNYVELISGEAVNAELQMSSEAVKIAPLTLETPRDRYLEYQKGSTSACRLAPATS